MADVRRGWRFRGTPSLLVAVPMAALVLGLFTVVTVAASNGAAPAPVLSAGDASIVEGTTGLRTLELPVTLSQVPTAPVTVDYSVKGVTAVSGRDFDAESGVLSFKAPSKSKPVPVESMVAVTVLSDATDGGGTLSLTLSAPTGGAVLGNAVGIGTIVEATGTAPSFNVGDAGIYDGVSGPSRTLDFAVSLSSPAAKATSVDYALVPDTAVATYDYASASGTVRFAKGAVSETVGVTVYPDVAPAPSRVLYLDLSKPVGAGLGRSTGTGVMIDGANGIATPLSTSYRSETLTADRHPSSGIFDTYAVSQGASETDISAPSTNRSGNSRLVFWPTAQTPMTNEESCARWKSQTPANGAAGASDQQGVALRVSTTNGITRAITVTKMCTWATTGSSMSTCGIRRHQGCSLRSAPFPSFPRSRRNPRWFRSRGTSAPRRSATR